MIQGVILLSSSPGLPLNLDSMESKYKPRYGSPSPRPLLSHLPSTFLSSFFLLVPPVRYHPPCRPKP